MFLLYAWHYMYPWLLQSMETSFKISTNSATEALNTLGLEEHATPEEIKKQVRSLLRTYHPDHNSDPIAKDMTQKILAAAEVLKDMKHSTSHAP